jgi:NADPH-dependent glutamate synthase beta subunit-like oxidoreductase/CO/xanthine dehydrogenase FAD-binding subunit
MKPFDHLNAESLEAATATLSRYEGKVSTIAGGTDLLGTLKDSVHPEYPEALLNLKTIPGLDYIEEDAQGLRIGALARLHEIEANQTVRDRYRVLGEAARAVASPQIRRMGTIGGNICQEPRCWYYRNPDNTFHCTRKGGQVCNALTGENQYHSIFGAARPATTPCTSSCPAGVDIPSYLSKIREGDLVGAARLLLEANPFPAVTGRVCPHFCEEACNRGEFDEALSVGGIERFVGDYVLDNVSELLEPPQAATGKRVAIVGSGPAGLSAAHYLRKLGHGVTLFDKMPEPGGMLRYAIPAYRLPKDVVRRIAITLEDAGVEFRLNTEVGKDPTVEDLKKDFDSVFLATGAWGQPSIGIEGEELTRSGLELLTNVNLGVEEVPGSNVVVIGGGSVATDVGICVLRLGAERVTLACLECREEMPAFEWEIEQAIEEGIQVMPSWGPVRVLEKKGKVTGLELVRCTSVFDSDGSFCPAFDDAITEKVEADQIIMAVGQRTDLSFLGPKSTLQVKGGLVVADEETQETSVPGIFAGGDVTSGRGTVVEAIAAGRRAAESIDRHLGRASVVSKDEEDHARQPLLKFNSDYLRPTGRVEMPELPVGQRRIDVEDALGLSPSQIEAEANRCFNCGCVAVCPSDIAPALIALGARVLTTKRTVDVEEFFAAGPGASTVLEPGELVKEIQIPAPKPGSRQAFLKYRLRKAIDFPIVAVACVLAMKADKVEKARIALGAVAPIPLRPSEAEAFLVGKRIDHQVAETAATMAMEGVVPLGKNRYKVQIAKALVRRAILAA